MVKMYNLKSQFHNKGHLDVIGKGQEYEAVGQDWKET